MISFIFGVWSHSFIMSRSLDHKHVNRTSQSTNNLLGGIPSLYKPAVLAHSGLASSPNSHAHMEGGGGERVPGVH